MRWRVSASLQKWMRAQSKACLLLGPWSTAISMSRPCLLSALSLSSSGSGTMGIKLGSFTSLKPCTSSSSDFCSTRWVVAGFRTQIVFLWWRRGVFFAFVFVFVFVFVFEFSTLKWWDGHVLCRPWPIGLPCVNCLRCTVTLTFDRNAVYLSWRWRWRSIGHGESETVYRGR